MIVARNVSKTFNAGRPNEFQAVSDLSLAIELRQATVLKGPSGSGKTTLLGMMGGMSRPSAGRIFIGDQEITSLPERFLTSIRRRTFGFIFQQFHLVKGLSVLENVMLPAYPTPERLGSLKGRALETLALFNLERKAEAKVEWLSGGEAQRTAIARALINDPAIIIADEPTAHLDTRLSREFLEIMRTLKEGGKTLILSSHDPIVCDSDLADRTVEMRDGRIVGAEEAA